MRKIHVGGALVLALALVACGGSEDLASDGARVGELEAEIAELEEALGEAPVQPAPPAPPRTAEGLVEQLHMRHADEVADDAPAEWEPGAGEWESAEIPEGYTETTADGHTTPGGLLTAFVSDFEADLLGTEVWEITSRVLPADADDEATGALLLWGLADDSLAGIDFRFSLRQSPEGWYVEDAESRPHCRRGVTGDGLCS